MSLPTSDRDVLLLHNPGCSKSRATLALLRERGIAFRERRYLEEPLTRNELQELGRRLGRPASEWVRPKEPAYAQAGLPHEGSDAGDAQLISAIAEHPSLLERPIVVRGERAVIGRPPENVLELF